MQAVKEFYFKEEAGGAIPRIRVTVAGREISVLDKLSIKHGSTNKDYVIYPSKLTIDFTANKEFQLGDEVEVRLYYQGSRWDGLEYYDWSDTPAANIFRARITSRNYNPLSIRVGGFWDYRLEENFSEISEKINTKKGETPNEIINKVSFLNAYEGSKVQVEKAGEYGLDVILSDLAKYRSFHLRDEGKNAIVEIQDKTARLKDTLRGVVLTCDLYTVSNSLAYSQNAKDLVQSVYWSEGDGDIKDLDMAGLVRDLVKYIVLNLIKEEEDEEKREEHNNLINGLISDEKIAEVVQDKNIANFFKSASDNENDNESDEESDNESSNPGDITGVEEVVREVIKDEKIRQLLKDKNLNDKNPTDETLKELKEKHLEKILNNALSLGNGKITVAQNTQVARNKEYFNNGLGEIVKVFNMFVPPGEVSDYLAWVLQREKKKTNFTMATSFISTPLGGVVNVATGYKDNYSDEKTNENNNQKKFTELVRGYQAVLTNKNITFKIGDKMTYDFNVNVTKVGEWTPQRFDWGEGWDNGGTW